MALDRSPVAAAPPSALRPSTPLAMIVLALLR
jgi:hypothetical protein